MMSCRPGYFVIGNERNRRHKAIAFPHHRLDVFGVLGPIVQAYSNFPNGGIDPLLGIKMDALAPKPLNDLFARYEFSLP